LYFKDPEYWLRVTKFAFPSYPMQWQWQRKPECSQKALSLNHSVWHKYHAALAGIKEAHFRWHALG